MRTLMWFRADLRVADNAALHEASRLSRGAGGDTGGSVVGVFVICPEQWREHDWAGVKVGLMLRTLRELSVSLAALNIPLLVVKTPRFEGTPKVLLEIAQRHSCDALHFNDEYEVNELRRDQLVRTAFESAGLRVRSFTDQCIVAPGEVRTAGGAGGFFTVFSPFKRALYKRILEDGGVRVYPPPSKQEPTGISPSPVPGSLAGFETDVPPETWPAGERAAMNRLTTFIEKQVRSYKAERDIPSIDGTSVLSPYLCVGSISSRQCMARAAEANGGILDGGSEEISHWISEVAWREFYKHILVGYPRVCMHRAFKPATDRIRWSDRPQDFLAWCEGRTGVPIVDAGMRQLRGIGWMHNRVRMIVAMYLTKDLFIDWRLGERHFMRNLVDGDLAPNNGGWQWSASTGTDAAPYFRIFNPISQSRKFDAAGAYIKKWVPELRDLDGGEDGAVHDPSLLPKLLRGTLDYPEPIADRTMTKDRVMRAFQALAE